MSKNRRLLFWTALAVGAWYVAKQRTAAIAPAATAPAGAQTTNVSPTNAPTTANMQGLAFADDTRHNIDTHMVGGLGISPFFNRPTVVQSGRFMAAPQYNAPRGFNFGYGGRRAIF
jgi:hypothetical protein